jgi:hypothetical protein
MSHLGCVMQSLTEEKLEKELEELEELDTLELVNQLPKLPPPLHRRRSSELQLPTHETVSSEVGYESSAKSLGDTADLIQI